MSKKNKEKALGSKGLKAALARHQVQDTLKQKALKNAQVESQNQLNKAKSMKTTKKAKQNNGSALLKQLRGYLPFTEEDTVLLVGEGDFSFAKSLILQNYVRPENLIATSLDSQEEVMAKYPDVDKTLLELQESGVRVMHDVDATDLAKTLKIAPNSKQRRTGSKASALRLFTPGSSSHTELDYIMFNFPHTGKGIKDQDRNIRDHQKLILEYFKNCNTVFDLVNENYKVHDDFAGYRHKNGKSNNKGSSNDDSYQGKIILSVFEGEPYNSWGIKIIGKEQGYKVMKLGKFDWSMFPQYHHKRTNGIRDTTKPASERDARLYVFEKNTQLSKTADSNKKRNEKRTGNFGFDSDSDSDEN